MIRFLRLKWLRFKSNQLEKRMFSKNLLEWFLFNCVKLSSQNCSFWLFQNNVDTFNINNIFYTHALSNGSEQNANISFDLSIWFIKECIIRKHEFIIQKKYVQTQYWIASLLPKYNQSSRETLIFAGKETFSNLLSSYVIISKWLIMPKQKRV